MYLKDSILINCTVGDLYRLLSDVEYHAKILPGYIESRIVQKTTDLCVIQREAMIHGKRRRWKSEVWFEENRAIHFRQSEGLLKGMRVDWVVENNSQITRLKIVHDVTLQPRWWGWWIEHCVAKPAIQQTARLCLQAIKAAAENRMAA